MFYDSLLLSCYCYVLHSAFASYVWCVVVGGLDLCVDGVLHLGFIGCHV